MDAKTSNTADREQRLDEAVTSYLQALGQGLEPDYQDWLARYPDLAEELAEYFAGREALEHVAAPLREVGLAAPTAVADRDRTVGNGEVGQPQELAGTEFGDYEILGEIGRGGMGVVYKARQKSLNRLVAVKVFRAGDLGGKAELQRFRNEAEMVALLDHAGIVPIHEVGTHAGRPYFTMKLIEGGSLADHLERFRADPRSAARLVAAVARAVHHAHQRGVLHRDLKPSNILLDGQGRPHVTDFGLAKRVETDTSLTQSGALVGTPSYMAPEQTSGRKEEVTIATDVYGLGAVLYAVLTGRPPFRAETLLDTLAQVSEREPELPRRLNLNVDRDLETICLKCLQKEPAKRYRSAEAVAGDLKRWLGGEPIQARPVGRLQRLGRWCRRKPGVAGLGAIAAAVVLLMTAGLGWVVRDRAAQRTETERAVTAALDEAARQQREGRMPEALAAARQAAWLMDRGVADEALRQRVQARRADLELLADLDEVRLQIAVTIHAKGYDYVAGDRFYTAAFQKAGLEIDALPIEVAVGRIQQSSVPTELAAALDHWALTRQLIRGPSPPSWKSLLQIARLADPDGWRSRLRQALERQDKRALVELAGSEEITQQPPLTLATLATALRVRVAFKQAEALLRQARQRQPGDFWINTDLAMILMEIPPARLEEAICFFTAAVAVRPSNPSAHQNLARGLEYKGRLDEAIAEYQEAIRIKQDFHDAHFNLATIFHRKGQLDEAIAENREAVRLKKDNLLAHNNLGAVLADKGRLDEAIAEFREAIRLKKKFPLAHYNLVGKDFPGAHCNLGDALQRKGRLGEAMAEYREAFRLKKDDPIAHLNFGVFLADKRLLDGAIGENREALRLKKDYPEAHYSLGNALRAKSQLDDAIAAYERAIELKKDYVEALCNLGHALLQQGHFPGALKALKRGHELGSKNPRWPYPSAQWVRNCERLMELDKRLPAILSGERQPVNAAERLAFADLCQLACKQRFAAATRFYVGAFAADRKLAGDPRSGDRYNAACAAAQAGCGRGKDAGKLDGKERSRLREKARTWLAADLRAWRKLLQKEPKARPAAAQQLAHWLVDTDFAGVRGEKALQQLPQAEREAWQKLWTEVEKTLDRARSPAK
jgi:serine/threonine-protein kinase